MEDNFIEKFMQSIEKRCGKEVSDLAYFVFALFTMTCILALTITHAIGPLYFFLKQIGILEIAILVIFFVSLVVCSLTFYSCRKSKKLDNKKEQEWNEAFKRQEELLNEIEKCGKRHEAEWKATLDEAGLLATKPKEKENAQSTDS